MLQVFFFCSIIHGTRQKSCKTRNSCNMIGEGVLIAGGVSEHGTPGVLVYGLKFYLLLCVFCEILAKSHVGTPVWNQLGDNDLYPGGH